MTTGLVKQDLDRKKLHKTLNQDKCIDYVVLQLIKIPIDFSGSNNSTHTIVNKKNPISPVHMVQESTPQQLFLQ